MIQINLLTKKKQIHRHRKQTYGYQRGWVRETNKEVGINIYNLLYLKWVSKCFLYSTGKYTQCLIINFNGKRIRERIYIHASVCIYIHIHIYICMHTQSLSSVRFFQTPWTILSVSSGRGILQARMVEWAAISYPRNVPDPEIKPINPALTGRFFTTVPPEKPYTHTHTHTHTHTCMCVHAQSVQLCPTL